MKVFIISDIGARNESMVPYGLNIGKHNETGVEILHIIDPRSPAGVSSPYSDSQSITPGKKMSHDEIMKRDKHQVEKDLDRLLSAEASRLNYPLKVETKVESGPVEPELKHIFGAEDDSICIASAIPGNSMITDLSELISIFSKLEVPLLIVPPGYAWREPAEIRLFNDFSGSSDRVTGALRWYDAFPLTIQAFGIVDGKGLDELEKRGENWGKTLGGSVGQNTVVKTSVISGKADAAAISDHIRQSAAGLVMLPKEVFTDSSFRLKRDADRVKFMSELNMPVLIY